MHLVNGTGNSPSPGRPTPGVVKQDKSSGGSVDTTKTLSDPQRVKMSSGERPTGAAKGKQSNTEALCQPPPPRPVAVATQTSGNDQSKPPKASGVVYHTFSVRHWGCPCPHGTGEEVRGCCL